MIKELLLWALLLGAACWAVFGASSSVDDAQPRAGAWLSDIDGAIAEMIIHFTPESGDLTAPTYGDLFRALPPDTTVCVAVEDEAAFGAFLEQMRRRGVPACERFRPLVIGREISTWARDRFLARADLPRAALFVPEAPGDASSPARRGDWYVPWTLANRDAETWRLHVSRLRFDGGDVVATATTVFVDANLVAKNVPAVFSDLAALRRSLERMSGKTVLVIGEREDQVPNHHIGMYLSPLPDGSLFVADARQGEDAYAEARRAGLPARFSEDFARRCDFVANALRERGFRVRRLPIFACEDPKTFVTYNNVLCQTTAQGFQVYLPRYGFAEFDERAQSLWRDAGAVVHPIDVRRIFVHRGSLRCLTQVLRRSFRYRVFSISRSTRVPVRSGLASREAEENHG